MSNENSIIDLQFPKLNCVEIHRVGSWKNEGLRQGQVIYDLETSKIRVYVNTLPIAKILSVKNARAWVSMVFTYR
jgi:hypothetical protein